MIRKIVPHLTIVVTVMMLVLIVINFVNDAMGFLRGEEFETLLIIYCVVSALSAAFLIDANSKRRRRMLKKKKIQNTQNLSGEDK